MSLGIAAGAGFAQAPGTLAFEVASIRPAEPITPQKVMGGKLRVGMTVNGRTVNIGFLSLADLIPLAYKVKSYQVSGPAWLKDQRFDITAQMPEGTTREQVPQMLQALLAERFKLAIHRESKEHSLYALVVGKKGLKMKEAEPEPEAPKSEAADNGDGSPPVKSEDRPMNIKADGKGMVITGGGQKGQMRVSKGSEGALRFESSRTTMSDLCEWLSRFVDRPVVDMTELKGEYQVGIDISMQDLMQAAKSMGAMPQGPGGPEPAKAPLDTASDPGGNSIFESVQQLGLKLEPRKGPIEIIVVDRVEKNPTEN